MKYIYICKIICGGRCSPPTSPPAQDFTRRVSDTKALRAKVLALLVLKASWIGPGRVRAEGLPDAGSTKGGSYTSQVPSGSGS